MRQTILVNSKHLVILCFLSIFLNGIFLWFNFKNKEYCFGTLIPHGEVAYNFFKYNSVKINPKRIEHIYALQEKSKHLIDYADINPEQFGEPTEYRSVHDTIGYGIILGLLWKITRSLKYRDIQFFQIILFSLFIMLFYQLGLLLFEKSQPAFLSGLALLLFFPVVFQNVQANRDVWSYYALILLTYAILSYKKGSSLFLFISGCVAFSFFEFVRPIVIFLPLFLFCVWGFYSWWNELSLVRLKKAVLWFTVINGVCFWGPFFAYNKIAYNRYFVGPKGIGLIEGLGEEANNPWGYELNDTWYENFMYKNFGVQSGTPECEDESQRLFFQSFKEHPGYFFKLIFKRIFSALLPNLPWSFYPSYLYGENVSFSQKLKKAVSSPYIFIDFVSRLFYVRIYLLIGYIGALMLLLRKHYFELFFLISLIASCFLIFFSHIEFRYLVAFYTPFAFFVGNCIWQCIVFTKRHLLS